jgi:pyridoxal phosphate enzyme (YggS family)
MQRWSRVLRAKRDMVGLRQIPVLSRKNMTSTTRQNLARINDQIAEAVMKAGRPTGSVRLIAVSKTYPAERVAEAIQAGQHVFGESRVQEALNKQEALAGLPEGESPVEWHLIGHLQTNKANFVPGAFQWVHTIDSLELAKRLSEASIRAGVICYGLIQVNVANDPAKQGIKPAELESLLERILAAELGGLKLRGLMTIGKLDAPECETRQSFAGLRALRDKARERFGLPDFSELSMGMSGDFQLAIAEGATLVRVGSAIFGERDYQAVR